jgi:hypothetical protein
MNHANINNLPYPASTAARKTARVTAVARRRARV